MAPDGGRGINIAVCSGGDRRGKRKHPKHKQGEEPRRQRASPRQMTGSVVCESVVMTRLTWRLMRDFSLQRPSLSPSPCALPLKHTTQHEQSKRARITDTAEAALRVREINRASRGPRYELSRKEAFYAQDCITARSHHMACVATKFKLRFEAHNNPPRSAYYYRMLGVGLAP
jgi:hypothetical protein